jgi:hypothetical protein
MPTSWSRISMLGPQTPKPDPVRIFPPRVTRGIVGLVSKPTIRTATFSDASVVNSPVFLRRQTGTKDDVNSARHKPDTTDEINPGGPSRNEPTSRSTTISDASAENRPPFLRPQIGTKDDVKSARHNDPFRIAPPSADARPNSARHR